MSENKNDMPFLQHLEELRFRLMRSTIAIFIAAAVIFVMKDFVVNTIVFGPRDPDFFSFRVWCKLSHVFGLGDKLCIGEIPYSIQSTTMLGPFTAHLLVAIVGGFIVAFPYVFWEIWGFVKPGLRKTEKSAIRGVSFFTSLLFFGGVLFGYFVIVPLSLQFLGGYDFGDVKVDATIGSYMKLVVSISLAAGIIFLLPILVYFLTKIGVVTPELLKRFRKHALVAVLIISAIITPPDITSQILVSLPVLVLYEISIMISRRVVKSRNKD